MLCLVSTGLGAQAQTTCAVTSTVDFTAATPYNGNWSNRAAIGVPVGSDLTTISTGALVSGTGTASLATDASFGTQLLSWDTNYNASSTNTSTITFTFSRAVTNLRIQVLDIDRLNDNDRAGYVDRVTFTGKNGTTDVVPLLTPTLTGNGIGTVSISGNVATGIGQNPTATQSVVTASFSSPVTTLTLVYDGDLTTSGNPNAQGIGIRNITFCTAPPNTVADAFTGGYNSSPTIDILSNDQQDLPIVATSVDLNSTVTGNQKTFTDTNSGIVYTANGTTGAITFTNPNNYVGTSTLSYTVADNAGQRSTGTLTLTLTNTAPVAVNDVAAASVSSAPIVIDVLSNDTDAEGNATIDANSIVLSGANTGFGTFTVGSGANSGKVLFTPGATAGTAIVSYTIKDNANPKLQSAPASIRVAVTNFAPTATDGVNATLVNTAPATVLSPSLSGQDIENNLAYFTITGGLPTAAQGILAFNGTNITTAPSINIPANQVNLLTFDPAANYVGRVVLSFRATDGTGLSSDISTYTIPVEAANTISGIVFEDVNYGGGTGVSQAASNGIGINGVRVELFNNAGTYQTFTTTATVNGVAGVYSFSGRAAGTYKVRVVNSSVGSSRSGYVAGLLPVQTYINGDGNRVGGETPSSADVAQTTGNLPGGAQSVATVILAANSSAGADFGFTFDAIVNTNDVGQGSLRQFLANASALANTGLDQRPFNNNGFDAGTDFPAGQETSIFMIPDGTAKPGLRAGLTNQLRNAAGNAATTASRALITLSTPLVVANTANAAATVLDGTTQSTLNDSNPAILGTGGTVGTDRVTLSQVDGPEIEIAGATSLANLYQVSADNSVLRGVSLHGGTNTVLVSGGTNALIEQSVVGINAFSVSLPALGTQSNGITLNNPSGIVRNNIIAYAGNTGLNYSGVGAGYTITNNEFYENGRITAGGDNITIADQVATGVAGPVTIIGNLIARSNSSGIQFDIAKISTNIVQNNTISENGLGGAVSRLEGSGIHYLSRNGTERGTNPDDISKNIIVNNQSSGIVINHGQRGIKISRNSIYQNGNGTTGGQGLLSVDLTPSTYFVNSTDANGKARYGQGDGVSPNDGLLDNNQANGGMDYPIITTIAKVGTNQLRIAGYIGNATAGNAKWAGAIVEVYSANNADTNQDGPTTTAAGSPIVAHGESQSFVGTITADGSGRFDVTFANVATNISSGDIITATAYLPAFGTSEVGVNLLSNFSVLPVQLTSFSARAVGQTAQLNWRTAQELNNAYFVIERSFDGQSFSAVGQVNGQGTTTQATDYRFTDAQAGQQAQGQVAYYRLRQVDTNGTTSYSTVQALSFATTADISVAPNPASGQASLQLGTMPVGQYQVTALDVTGRAIYQASAQGGQAQALPVGQWPAGVYLIRVQGQSAVKTTRFVKE